MPDTTPIKIGIKIPNDPNEIQEYTLKVINAISRHVSLTAKIQRKIKLILIELVTNSIKHSEDPDALIRLTIKHPKLTIEKVDVGLQIKFQGAEQIPFQEANKNIKVSFSENNSYHVKIIDQYRFQFIDSFNENMNIDRMPEHFGLYIITMASDSFEYQHNPKSNENTFIVNVNL
ncbi:anti-sigma regulatory factor (Ser/Thr protein kinase) [Pedobacter sp. CG_S7]|uniref:ATP-binding protein n=1 Tax=Pedobacter sp. CG_S7 TaxID=3143930 RepID=UPI00339A454C